MFTKATKEGSYLRLAVFGAAGNGKTKFALELGKLLGKVALIDTEHGTASKYADQYDFDTCILTSFGPEDYVKAISAARGYDVLVIDSLSHAWNGKGGCLELADKYASSGNTFSGWKTVTPMHNSLLDSLLAYPGHLIVTMRSKTEYATEQYQDRNGNTKTRPVKLGLAPIQRDGVEYEFDVVARLEQNHDIAILKSRCESLDSKVLPAEDGVSLCYQELASWVAGRPTPAASVSKEDWEDLKQIGKDNRWPTEYMRLWIDKEKKSGKSNSEVFKAAVAKFSQTNENEATTKEAVEDAKATA
jgi:hypothetical protein